MTQDRNGKEINIGSIVTWINGEKSQTGRISRLTKTRCNLRGVWGGRIFAKGVSLKEVEESSAEFYSAWERSDAYQCM
jgi:hypothetical protein